MVVLVFASAPLLTVLPSRESSDALSDPRSLFLLECEYRCDETFFSGDDSGGADGLAFESPLFLDLTVIFATDLLHFLTRNFILDVAMMTLAAVLNRMNARDFPYSRGLIVPSGLVPSFIFAIIDNVIASVSWKPPSRKSRYFFW